jgi:hypothetical protein
MNLKYLIRSLSFLLLLPLLALASCGGDTTNLPPQANLNPPAINRNANAPKTNDQNLTAGKYGLQQATFDDGDGIYNLMLLDTPAGMPAVVKTKDLKMARLTEEEIKAGQKSYYQVESGSDTLHLSEDFRIEYVHNVTENRTDPQTGQTQPVVVRQESNFWTPFLGSLAGNALGNMLFRPQYYVPPMYQPGVAMVGYGGYGNSYGSAVDNYRGRYNAPPLVERNRTTFRNSGSLNEARSRGKALSSGSGGAFEPARQRPKETVNNRPTGAGFGSSRLESPKTNRSPRVQSGNRSRSSFGSGGGRSGRRR